MMSLDQLSTPAQRRARIRQISESIEKHSERIREFCNEVGRSDDPIAIEFAQGLTDNLLPPCVMAPHIVPKIAQTGQFRQKWGLNDTVTPS